MFCNDKQVFSIRFTTNILKLKLISGDFGKSLFAVEAVEYFYICFKYNAFEKY